jgi:hypothetical protein
MGASSAPEFPYPGGTPGKEPADPVAGKPGHFAWSRWIKEFVKRLDRDSVKNSGDTMTGPLVLKNGVPESQLRVDATGLIVSTPITASTATANTHLVTKSYVDTRVPLYHEVTMTADGTGWATPAGLKAGAVVFSMIDVSSTPAVAQLLLNPSTNKVYLGANATRTIRLWYV